MISPETITDLENGCVFALQDEYALERDDRDALRARFYRWLETEGWPLVRKVRDGELLSEAEQPLRWLATMTCVWRADKCIYRDDQGDELESEDQAYLRYGRELVSRAQDLLRRGYRDELLTDADWETLRAYRVYAECRILHVPFWPYELGIHEHGPKSRYVPSGALLPDLHWMTWEGGLREPGYTDAPPPDYFKIARPEILDELRRLLAAYEPCPGEDGLVRARPVPAGPQRIHLSHLVGRRPVALIVAAATDCFWARVAPVAEHLYQVYRGKIQFLWLNITLSDFLIQGDTTLNYHPPHVGLELPGHESSLADRARTAKKVYLTHPQITLPCVLDDMGDTTANFFHENGGAAALVLVDREGRVAAQTTHNWDHWLRGQPPGRGFCEQFAWADEAEREIRALLAGDGLWDPEHPPFDRHDEPHQAIGGPRTMYLANSRVEHVDWEQGRVEVRGRVATFTVVGRGPDDPEPFNDPHPMTLWVDEETRLAANGHPVARDELKPGDVIFGPGFVCCEDRPGWSAREIQLHRPPGASQGPAARRGSAYLLAIVLSVDPGHGAFWACPRLPINEMKGRAIIESGEEPIELIGPAKTHWEALQHWLAARDQHVEVRCDAGTWLSRNGERCELGDLRPGDCALIWHEAREAGSRCIHGAVVRASESVNGGH